MTVAAMAGARDERVTRTEYFRTEYEALQRAHQLLEERITMPFVCTTDSGSVLAGIRLQLKLGASIAD